MYFNKNPQTLETESCLIDELHTMEETKIFVVITVLSTVLIGLAVYLFWLDRRVTKMEKEINNSKKQS